MRSSSAILPLALAFLASQASLWADCAVSGNIDVQVASAFLSSTGLHDTCPVTTQMGYLKMDFGAWGFIDGYGWIISTLHDKQHERHRAAFNEFEGAVQYGYDWRFREGWRLRTKFGAYWDPAIGYRDGANNLWGPYFTQSLDNPYLTPCLSALQIVAPERKGRIKFGLKKTFVLGEKVEISPFVESLWMDARRFSSKYGDTPERDRVFGGTFATLQTGVRASYAISGNTKLTVQLIQYDVINGQARRSIHHSDKYYAKCDWPVVRIGIGIAL